MMQNAGNSRKMHFTELVGSSVDLVSGNTGASEGGAAGV